MLNCYKFTLLLATVKCQIEFSKFRSLNNKFTSATLFKFAYIVACDGFSFHSKRQNTIVNSSWLFEPNFRSIHCNQLLNLRFSCSLKDFWLIFSFLHWMRNWIYRIEDRRWLCVDRLAAWSLVKMDYKADK